MADGRYWMVQDLKFGDKCNKEAFVGSTTDQTISKLTSISGYIYGDCMNKTDGSTPGNRGYLYDWAAAIQKPGAYYGGTDVGCSGTGGASCQGICPVGWHIPTGGSAGEYQALHTAMTSAGCSGDATCWNASSAWEGVLGGWCYTNGTLDHQGSRAYYWSSTYYDSNNAYFLRFLDLDSIVNPANYYYQSYGLSVRCVRNY
jgi:uncharacterized protein (TIGR02145 family)